MEKKLIKVVFICGVSGGGKDYIAGKLCDNNHLRSLDVNFHNLKQSTTRSPRSEDEHERYNFLSKEELLKKIYKDEMFAITHFNNTWYGTELSNLVKNEENNTINIAIVNTLGYMNGRNILNMLNDSEDHEYKYEYILIRIIPSEIFEKREGRDEEFLENEKMQLDVFLNYEVDLFIKNEYEDVFSRRQFMQYTDKIQETFKMKYNN